MGSPKQQAAPLTWLRSHGGTSKDLHSTNDDETARSPGAAVVFDSGERAWAGWLGAPAGGPVPVASAGGLVLYRDQTSGDLTVVNPLTGATRALPSPPPAASTDALHAVAMYDGSSPQCYRVFLFLGDLPDLSVLAFDSSTNAWDHEPVPLTRQHPAQHQHDAEPEPDDDDDGAAVYFLSKSGDVVVSTTTYRIPSRQYACAVTRRRSGPTNDDGGSEAVVAHFLSRSGTVVSVDVARRAFAELPRVHPARHEHAIDVVACDGGAAYAVVLSEFLGAASLRVWEFAEGAWRQVAAMPPAMANAFVGAKADVNCVGHGDRIMVCVTGSGEADINGCFLCDVKSNRWEELPRCVVGGDDGGGDLVAAVSFEPRIEAAV
ncbi:hypothetical protein PR202_ga29171 [Eleusine coracana subsp. coracana]|uniref:Uncharacterized protein n=1 Tax=Eleusine coracana subsp. coracana TaxID=191504 RepID=A0AAV5DKH0_ELECO|nr:hypothetical protein PR202_ga29171 [Eleusine coracana subsp. coracana]